MPSDDHAALSLGERLRIGVVNLWKEVQRLGRVQDQHGMEIEEMRRRMDRYERELHSIRTSRGIQVAKNRRLRDDLDTSEAKLADIRRRLDS